MDALTVALRGRVKVSVAVFLTSQKKNPTWASHVPMMGAYYWEASTNKLFVQGLLFTLSAVAEREYFCTLLTHPGFQDELVLIMVDARIARFLSQGFSTSLKCAIALQRLS